MERSAQGEGPVDATFKAIEAAVGVGMRLRTFEVRSVTAGEDAQGEAVVCADCGERSYRGSSVSTNIVESSTHAFLQVINQVAQRSGRRRAHRATRTRHVDPDGSGRRGM